MIVIRTTEEIDAVLAKAQNGVDDGGKYCGMLFEEGILEMFDWLVGNHNESPMPD